MAQKPAKAWRFTTRWGTRQHSNRIGLWAAHYKAQDSAFPLPSLAGAELASDGVERQREAWMARVQIVGRRSGSAQLRVVLVARAASAVIAWTSLGALCRPGGWVWGQAPHTSVRATLVMMPGVGAARIHTFGSWCSENTFIVVR
eukprot:7384460-Prymnesium_polylepis.2